MPGHGQANTEHWHRPGFGHQRAALLRSAAQGVRKAHPVLSKPCKFTPHQRVMAAARGHGRGGRKQNRGKLARRTRPQEKVGHLASWGPGVLTPGCLREQGRGATTRLIGHKAAVGVLGPPSLAVWRSALTGQCPLSASRGPLPGCLSTVKQSTTEAARQAPAAQGGYHRTTRTATGCGLGVAGAAHDPPGASVASGRH